MASLADKFSGLVKAEGLLGAMRWLNERVPYRFTAIFAFQADVLRNVCLVDKEDANITHCYRIAASRGIRSGAIFTATTASRC